MAHLPATALGDLTLSLWIGDTENWEADLTRGCSP